MKPYRTKLHVTFDNVNVSAIIAEYLEDFKYTDNSSKAADSIEIRLRNDTGVWFDEWLPEKGAKIQASIIQENLEAEFDAYVLNCGTFYVDEISFNGAPATVSIKGTAIAADSTIRNNKKSKSWENTNLQTIANEIATQNGISLEYYVEEDIIIERAEQLMQSDMEFLNKLAVQYSLNIKVTDEKIVVYDKSTLENQDAVLVISRLSDYLLSYDFNLTVYDTYDKVEVSYYDTKAKKVVRKTVTKAELDNAGKESSTPKDKNNKNSKSNSGKKQNKRNRGSKNKNNKTVYLDKNGNPIK